MKQSSLIEDATANGCRKKIACRDLGLSIRTILRREQREVLEDQRPDALRIPGNKSTRKEEERMIAILSSEEFKDQTEDVLNPNNTHLAVTAKNGLFNSLFDKTSTI